MQTSETAFLYGNPSGILLSAADKGFCSSERKKQPFHNPGTTRIALSGELEPPLKRPVKFVLQTICTHFRQHRQFHMPCPHQNEWLLSYPKQPVHMRPRSSHPENLAPL